MLEPYIVAIRWLSFSLSLSLTHRHTHTVLLNIQIQIDAHFGPTAKSVKL